MSNARLLYSNRYSGSATVLTASTEASAALPVEASANPDRSYCWRSETGTGEASIDIDLGSVLAVTSVAVANVRLVGAGVLKLQERGDGGSPGAASDVVTLSTQDGGTRVAAAFFASQSHRHWRLLWTNPGSASDYAELGYCHLGLYFEPANNVRVPMPTRIVDPSIVTPSLDGQTTGTSRTLFTAGSAEFYYATQTDAETFDAVYRAVGTRTPWFLVVDTAVSWMAWLVKFVSPIERTVEENYERFTLAFGWEEAR